MVNTRHVVASSCVSERWSKNVKNGFGQSEGHVASCCSSLCRNVFEAYQTSKHIFSKFIPLTRVCIAQGPEGHHDVAEEASRDSGQR